MVVMAKQTCERTKRLWTQPLKTADMLNFMLYIFYHQKKKCDSHLGNGNEGMEAHTSFPENKGCVRDLLYVDDK